MKYTVSIEIALPREQVAQLLADPAHLPMRLVSLVMRGAFRKQSLQHMEDFKAFAEQGIDVREAKD